jgi:hypothetical protein
MKWCNPCALVWVVILSAFASHVWLNVDWTYSIAAVVVLLPLIAVYVRREREDLWWFTQNLIADIWSLLVNRPRTSAERKNIASSPRTYGEEK